MNQPRRRGPEPPTGLRPKDLLPFAAVLGPHAVAIVGIAATANYAAAQGVDGYLAYGFAVASLLAYVLLAMRTGR